MLSIFVSKIDMTVYLPDEPMAAPYSHHYADFAKPTSFLKQCRQSPASSSTKG